MENKPLISLCIPTNGVIYLFAPVLESIYKQECDENRFEVIVTDNGNNEEFKEYILKECKKHKNLKYFKTNASAFINEIEAYKQASGIFIKFVNHRTMMVGSSLEYLFDFVEKYKDEKPCVYFLNGNGQDSLQKIDSNFDQYVYDLSLYATWSTGMAFWKEDFEKLNIETYNELFPHTDILFAFKDKSKYIVDNKVIFNEIQIDHSNKGKYDLFNAFGVEFINIEKALLDDKKISKNTFEHTKKAIKVFLTRYYYEFVMKKQNVSYDLSTFKESMSVYYRVSSIKRGARRVRVRLAFKNLLHKVRSSLKRTKTEDNYFIFDHPIKMSIKDRIRHFTYYLKNPGFNRRIKKHAKKIEPKKYYSAICGIFKNEGPYLKEWIEYHLMIGINHIYLYNNNSTDDFMSVVDPYIKSNQVTLVNWEKNQAQMEAYDDCIKRFKSETNWLGFIDIDEFINPQKDVDFNAFLKEHENNCSSIMIYWRFFGADGLEERDIRSPVIKDFRLCWSKLSNVGKCFFNTAFDYDLASTPHKTLHHDFWARVGNKDLPPKNTEGYFVYCNHNKLHSINQKVIINHYFTKSKAEYVFKKTKGDVYFKINPHDDSYFNYHNNLCCAYDESIVHRVPELEKRI